MRKVVLSKLKKGGLGDPNWPVFGKILDWLKILDCSEIWHGGTLTQIKIIGEIVFFFQTKKMGGFRASDFDKIIDQSNVNGFSWRKKIIFIKMNYPHLAGARTMGPYAPKVLVILNCYNNIWKQCWILFNTT